MAVSVLTRTEHPGIRWPKTRPVKRLLANLQAADDALRDNLHVHNVDTTARAHMQRALCHLREAFIAINEGQARSVEEVVREQAGFERLKAAAYKLSEQHNLGLAVPKRTSGSIRHD